MFFYVFRGQTSANAFSSDLKYGGAAYAATGRGYKLKVGVGMGHDPCPAHVHLNRCSARRLCQPLQSTP
jgi:hypothetical protein